MPFSMGPEKERKHSFLNGDSVRKQTKLIAIIYRKPTFNVV